MAFYLLQLVRVREIDDNGDPVAGALLYTWAAGTTTPLATYTDSTGSTPLPNPIVADSEGFFPAIWVTGASYKLQARKPDTVSVLWTNDNVRAPGAAEFALADWLCEKFRGDGVTVAFTITEDPDNINNIDMVVDGIWLTPGVDFSKSGKTLTLLTIVPEEPTDPAELNVVIRYGRSVTSGALTGAVLQQLDDLYVPLTAIGVRDDTAYPHIGVGIAATTENLAVFKGTTSRDGTGIGSLVQIQREYDEAQAWTGNKNALRVLTTVGDGTVQAIGGPVWSISAEATASENVTISGDLTALSAVTKKYSPDLNAIAGHFQVRCPVISAAPADVTPCVAVEMNMPVVGADNPTANNGAGNRHTITLFARTDRTVSAEPGFADGETGSAIFIQHTQGSTASEGEGYYRFGIIIRDHVNHAGPHALKESAIRVDTWGKYGIHMASGHTIANIFLDEGSATYGYPAYGLVCNSDNYTSGTAIRVNEGQYIAFDATNSVRMKYDSGLNQLIFEKGGVVRGHIDLAGADHAL